MGAAAEADRDVSAVYIQPSTTHGLLQTSQHHLRGFPVLSDPDRGHLLLVQDDM
jgi:hypothetical protein